MSDQRKGGIAWTDETWNPVRGCSRVSPGCDNCYAMSVAYRFRGEGQPYEGLATLRKNRADWTGVVREVKEHMGDPLRWKRPRRIFVNSMSDLFHESLSFEFIAAVFSVMASANHHTFQVLTKRPKQARKFFDWVAQLGDEYIAPIAGTAVRHEITGKGDLTTVRLKRFAEPYVGRLDVRADKTDELGFEAMPWPLPNVWLGVSAENQEQADARVPLLLELPAAVRFVSAEPLLGPLILPAVPDGKTRPAMYSALYSPLADLDWVIVGGESGPRARPFDVVWAENIVDDCRVAGVACFVKQLGAVAFDSRESDRTTDEPHPGGAAADPSCRLNLGGKGGDPAEWPEQLRVQEFPR